MATLAMQPQAVPRPVVTSTADLVRILPLVLLIYCVMATAPEARLQIADLQFYTYRLLFLASLPVILYRLAAKQWQFKLPDALLLIVATWPILSFAQVYDLNFGIKSGGSAFLDYIGAYFIARACIQSPSDLRRVLIFAIPAVIYAACWMAVESISGRMIYRPFAASVFGALRDPLERSASGLVILEPEFRLGLLRAYGTFTHPILGGLILISLLPLYFFSRISLVPRAMGAFAAVGGVFAISSAALAALVMSIGIWAVNFVKARIEGVSWQLVVTLTAVAMTTAHFASKGGIFNFISRATLDPTTAYVRQQIYRYGWQSITRNPWFGIGYEEYQRPPGLTPSIDSHYLLQGVMSGMIPAAASLILVIYLMFALGSRLGKMKDPVARDMLLGVNITMFVLFLTGFTVAFYGEGRVWFYVILGLSASLIQWADKANRATGVVAGK